MRETIYLQAGPTANFVGSHFFCTQFAYYPEVADDDAPVDLDIVFRNARSQNPTPRAVVMDFKANFRGIPIADDVDANSDDATWAGHVERYTRLPPPTTERTITSWSDLPLDYDRERSLVPITNNAHPDWDTNGPEGSAWGDWSAGHERYAAARDEFEERLRVQAEDCDLLQGIQSIFDTPTFGSFSISALQFVKDEYSKIPLLAIPILSKDSFAQGSVLPVDEDIRRKILNDALVMAGLERDDDPLASLIVPVQCPSSWTQGAWLGSTDFNPCTTYEASALLSTHIETITLPTRLPNATMDMYSFAAHLNWRGDTRIANLLGAFPAPESLVSSLLYDFSLSEAATNVNPANQPYAMRYVVRGAAQLVTDEQTSYPLFQTTQALPYPIHHAYPSSMQETKPAVVSALATSSLPATLLKTYARTAEQVVALKMDASLGEDVDIDILRETAERLWTLHDGYID